MERCFYNSVKCRTSPAVSIIIASTIFAGNISTVNANIILKPIESHVIENDCNNITYNYQGIKKDNIGYNNTDLLIRKGGIMGYNTFEENLEILNDISQLEENWNDNGAPSISNNLIERMRGMLLVLPVQPEIFPTARPSVQFEYEKEDGDYLKFELLEDNSTRIYRHTPANKQRVSRIINFDSVEIVKVVKDFYGITE